MRERESFDATGVLMLTSAPSLPLYSFGIEKGANCSNGM